MPLYKEDCHIKSEPNIHRPISILPIIVSKIIKKVIFNQLCEYVNSNNLLAGSRHGFRPMNSTLTALLEATNNNWYLNIDNGLINGFLFLDLKKAFDTVDHSILLRKLLLCLHLSGSNHTYIRSYIGMMYICQWNSVGLPSCQLRGPIRVCTWTPVGCHLYK